MAEVSDAGIVEAGHDRVNSVERLRDKLVDGSGDRWGTTGEELELRRTWAVTHSNGASKLDTGIERKRSAIIYASWQRIPYKSPGVMLCFATKGFCLSTISSMPALAWKFVSMSLKVMMEPSAPPPL